MQEAPITKENAAAFYFLIQEQCNLRNVRVVEEYNRYIAFDIEGNFALNSLFVDIFGAVLPQTFTLQPLGDLSCSFGIITFPLLFIEDFDGWILDEELAGRNNNRKRRQPVIELLNSFAKKLRIVVNDSEALD